MLIDREMIQQLYGAHADQQDVQSRYEGLIASYSEYFSPPEGERLLLFSTPGRTELGGNHTDHNHGRVLAASINLDTIGAVSARADNQVLLISEGYPEVHVDISSTEYRSEEEGTTEALVRGIADYFRSSGVELRGFQAFTTSRVLKGSGLSSSAAVEVIIGTIFNTLYADSRFSPVEIAKAGQYSENRYFGKPSGLMDQVACSCGGVAAIDFQDPSEPQIDRLDIDFAHFGYSLCVTDTGGNHAHLTPCYAAIPEEMKAAAKLLGRDHLRGVTLEELLDNIQRIRSAAGDRAWLRSLHFVLDNQRVTEQVQALKDEDIMGYLDLVNQSGASSIQLLQNSYPTTLPEEQGISTALALTELFFQHTGTSGACRVHGGGFAGTIQAYIPLEHLESYRSWMERVFGEGSVTRLTIRNRQAGCIAETTV